MAAAQHLAWIAMTTVKAGGGEEKLVEFSAILTDLNLDPIIGQVHSTVRSGSKHPDLLSLEVEPVRRAALERVGLWRDLGVNSVSVAAVQDLCADLFRQVPGPIQAVSGPTLRRDQRIIRDTLPQVHARLLPEWIDAYSVNRAIGTYVPELPVMAPEEDTRTYHQAQRLMQAFAQTFSALRGDS